MNKLLFWLFTIFYLLTLFNCSTENSTENTEPSSAEEKEQNKTTILTPENPSPYTPITYDPMFKDQWHLKNTGQLNGKVGIDINVQQVWQKGYLGQGMFVGIIDGFLDGNHPELKENTPSENIVNYISGESCLVDFHATAVAGIIGARDNGKGMQGIAPRVTFYGYGVLGEDATKRLDPSHFVNIFSRKENQKIAVYNGSISFGEEIKYNANQSMTQAIDTAITKGFYGKGSSLVFSAANVGILTESANSLFLNHYGVIGVNAITEKGSLLSQDGGKIGPNLWLAAPSDVLSANASCKEEEKSKLYKNISATSSAAPMVSGAITLLRQAYPNLTWRDVKLILAESATKMQLNERQQKFYKYQKSGDMIHDKNKSQFYSRHSGFGLLNVTSAFNVAQNWQLLPAMKTFNSPFQNELLALQYDNVFRENSLTVNNSDINYIESIQVNITFESDNEIELSHSALHLVSPDNKERAIFHGTSYHFANIEVKEKKVFFLINAFLGSSQVNGTWKLKMKLDPDYNDDKTKRIKGIKSWNLVIRGH